MQPYQSENLAKSALVITPYSVFYADPISVNQGDAIALTGRTDNWQGHTWLWARASDGREGWVPDSLIDSPATGTAVVQFDYSAQELDCTKDEVLRVVKHTHGWTWCINRTGKERWVPDQHLRVE